MAKGQVNTGTDVQTKTVSQILAEHTFTLFNAVMLILGVLVFSTGRFSNALFLIPVVLNIFIAAFQEIRSKRAIDKLKLLAARDVSVMRDGVEVAVPLEGLVVDDCVHLGRGDQVPADSVVIAGLAAVDESLLTGESVEIDKRVGDTLLSGSFLNSGDVWCRVEKVGKDGYAAHLSAEAKYVKRARSEIVETLEAIIRLSTALLLPLGIGLYLRSSASDVGHVDALLTTVSALVGLIPQGLILLTSTVFAIAATRLATKNVLVQQLYCTEALARVDTVCLDKTGTITSGAMEVAQTRALDSDFERALATLAASEDSKPNETAQAIIAYARGLSVDAREIERSISFSSATKYAGCTFVGGAYVMGAPQFVMGERFAEIEGDVRSFEAGERVLVVARVDGFDEHGTITSEPQVLGFVAIRDEVRDTAAETIQFFADQGVCVRVISGDDPVTVSQIAQSVGIEGADRYVDATQLETTEDIAAAAERYRIFGRVTPEQKRELVRALKAQGHTVAMTGDGVNDVLALREADCSVAMSSGSDAARNVAEIVLVDNDFAHMPEVVAQGRQSINNLERSASLFLVKTVFSALLAAICIIWPPYPFVPVQMTLLSAAVIGVPSFLLALEPNHDRVSGNFLERVLARSLPASVGIVCGLGVAILVARLSGWSQDVESTMCMYIVAAVGIALIVRISLPLTTLRKAVVALVAAIFVGGCVLFPKLFEVAGLTAVMWAVALGCAALGVGLFVFGFNRLEKDAPGVGICASCARFLGGAHE